MIEPLRFENFRDFEAYADTNGRYQHRVGDPTFQTHRVARVPAFAFCYEHFGENGMQFDYRIEAPWAFIVTSTWLYAGGGKYWFDREEDAVAFALFGAV